MAWAVQMSRARLRQTSFLMRLPLRHAAVAVLVIVPSLLLATPHDPAWHASGPGLRFEQAGAAEEISIPFQKVNQHLLLSVTVNGDGPFQIILDTGMPMEDVILYDSERVKALNLTYLDDAQLRVSGAGGDGKGMAARL